MYLQRRGILINKFLEHPKEQIVQHTEQLMEKDDCQICLMEMSLEEELYSCHQCRKFFHFDCIRVWVEKSVNGTCPNCRGTITFTTSQNNVMNDFAELKKQIENM